MAYSTILSQVKKLDCIDEVIEKRIQQSRLMLFKNLTGGVVQDNVRELYGVFCKDAVDIVSAGKNQLIHDYLLKCSQDNIVVKNAVEGIETVVDSYMRLNKTNDGFGIAAIKKEDKVQNEYAQAMDEAIGNCYHLDTRSSSVLKGALIGGIGCVAAVSFFELFGGCTLLEAQGLSAFSVLVMSYASARSGNMKKHENYIDRASELQAKIEKYVTIPRTD